MGNSFWGIIFNQNNPIHEFTFMCYNKFIFIMFYYCIKFCYILLCIWSISIMMHIFIYSLRSSVLMFTNTFILIWRLGNCQGTRRICKTESRTYTKFHAYTCTWRTVCVPQLRYFKKGKPFCASTMWIVLTNRWDTTCLASLQQYGK